MHIIHLADHFYPHGGGVEYHLEKISEHFLADGHRVTIITVQESSDLALHEEWRGFHILRLPTFDWSRPGWRVVQNAGSGLTKTIEKVHRWGQMIRLLPFLRTAQVVQIHDVFWWIAPLWWLIPTQVYMTFHGYESEQGPHWRQKLMHQVAVVFTDGSLAIGGFHEEWYGVQPSLVKFGAIDPALFLNSDKSGHQPSRENDTPVRVVYLGRLQPGTGVDTLVEAVSLLPRELQKRLHVEIYGQGKLRDQLQDSISGHHLSDSISLHGFVPTAREELKTADLAVVSQYLAILEALAVGVKTLSYAGSAFKAAVLQSLPVSEALTLTRSAAEMAEQLAILVSDQDQLHSNGGKPDPLTEKTHQRMAAQQWARSQTWDEMVQAYYQLWEGKDD